MGYSSSDENMLKLLVLISVFQAVLLQDTYYCPDGWTVMDVGGVIECILMGGLNERVTKQDATAICAFHGGWMVDMNESRGPQVSNFLKDLIREVQDVEDWQPSVPGPHYGSQWWIGATCDGNHHDDHNWGNWTWDNAGTELKYYDWMDGEPNDFRSQNCLTFVNNFVAFGFYNTYWNDWDCNEVARYICEMPGNV